MILDLPYWQTQDHRFLVPEQAPGKSTSEPESESLATLPSTASDAEVAEAIGGHPDAVYIEVDQRRHPRRATLVRRLLTAAGYGDQHWYLISPNLDERRECAGLDDAIAVRALLARRQAEGASRAKLIAFRAALATRTLPHLAPSLAVAARRSTTGTEPWLTTRLREVDPEVRSTLMLTPRFPGSRYVIVLGYDRDARLHAVAKAARMLGPDTLLRSEADALATCERLGVPGIVVPRLLAMEEAPTGDVLIQSGLDGDALSPNRVRADPSAWPRLAELVAHFPATGPLSPDTLAPLTAPLVDLARNSPGSALSELAQRTLDLSEQVSTHVGHHVMEHGDVSHPNLVQSPAGLGLVDWERFQLKGLPGHDLTIAAEYLTSTQTAPASEARVQAFGDAMWNLNGWARQALHSELDRRDVDPEMLPALVALTWGRVVAIEAGKHPSSTVVDRMDGRRECLLSAQAVEMATR